MPREAIRHLSWDDPWFSRLDYPLPWSVREMSLAVMADSCMPYPLMCFRIDRRLITYLTAIVRMCIPSLRLSRYTFSRFCSVWHEPSQYWPQDNQDERVRAGSSSFLRFKICLWFTIPRNLRTLDTLELMADLELSVAMILCTRRQYSKESIRCFWSKDDD